MQGANQQIRFERIQQKHVEMNERLLMKLFEVYYKNPRFKHRDGKVEALCQALNNANRRCKNIKLGGMKMRSPQKAPSLVISRSGTRAATTSRHAENMARSPSKKQLQDVQTHVIAKAIQLVPPELKETIEEQLNESAKEHLDEVMDAQMEAAAVFVDNSNLIQFSPKRDVPIITETPPQTPGRPVVNQRPDRNFLYAPMRRKPRSRKETVTSTPNPRALNANMNFSVTIPLEDGQSIQIASQNSFTRRDLQTVKERLEQICEKAGIDLNETFNRTKFNMTAVLGLTPGKYDIFKVNS